jgi:hypothetical protein
MLAFLLFLVIYFAVRLAISPLIKVEEIEEKSEFSLEQLKDMRVFDDDEFKKVIQIYQKRSYEERCKEEFLQYAKILNELKEMGHLSETICEEKMEKLKACYRDISW